MNQTVNVWLQTLRSLCDICLNYTDRLRRRWGQQSFKIKLYRTTIPYDATSLL